MGSNVNGLRRESYPDCSINGVHFRGTDYASFPLSVHFSERARLEVNSGHQRLFHYGCCHASFKFLPTGHDTVTHHYVVPRDQREGEVLGEDEDRVSLVVLGMNMGVLKTERGQTQLFQHRADVPNDIGVRLPGQLRDFLGGHRGNGRVSSVALVQPGYISEKKYRVSNLYG